MIGVEKARKGREEKKKGRGGRGSITRARFHAIFFGFQIWRPLRYHHLLGDPAWAASSGDPLVVGRGRKEERRGGKRKKKRAVQRFLS